MPLIREPNAETQEVLQTFRWFRGGMVSAFSQVEFGMCRLLSCLRQRDEFAIELQRLPFKAPDRAKRFRSVFVTSELLSPYSERAAEIGDTFELIIVPRNFLAHGFARIDMPARTIQMRKFDPISGDTWNEAHWDIPFDRMEPWGRQTDSLAQATVALCIEVSEELGLEF